MTPSMCADGAAQPQSSAVRVRRPSPVSSSPSFRLPSTRDPGPELTCHLMHGLRPRSTWSRAWNR
eukprot:4450027-Prymnesium_polylepis.1